jgi:cobalt-zinc-cadmium resistance protein CzcA
MRRWVELLFTRSALVVALALAVFVAGIFAFLHLDIEAYPDPTPPRFEVIAQYPGRSAEEVERYVTIPLESALGGLSDMASVRSQSFYGLADISLQFSFAADYAAAEQAVRNRLADAELPEGVDAQISPESTIGEVYRYQLVGPPGMDRGELRAIEDWLVERRLKSVSGVNDVTAWGGPAREYHVDVDPRQLQAYGIALGEVVEAVEQGNKVVGGRTIDLGEQAVQVRGAAGALTVDDLARIPLARRGTSTVLVRDVAQVRIGTVEPLGSAGRDGDDAVVEGIVLMAHGESTTDVVEGIEAEVAKLNAGELPAGVRIEPFYDRKELVHVTVRTVLRNLLCGMALVFAVQYLFLGEVWSALAVAAAIPFALCFAIVGLWLTGESANLLSIGAIDFGIIVDANVIVVENLARRLRHRRDPGARVTTLAEAFGEVAPLILFATAIILAAYIPLFTMHGVEGQIFAPMARTYAFALAGALLAAFTVSPVLTALVAGRIRPDREPPAVAWLRRPYRPALRLAQEHPLLALLIAGTAVAIGGVGALRLGGEFMPHLEEGNLWVRVTLPATASLRTGEATVHQMRALLASYPEVRTVVSQHGRPDDGTDPGSFSNLEMFVALKPFAQWPAGVGKRELVERMADDFAERFVGCEVNFTQAIQDQVEEAVAGIKGENAVKIYGPDLARLDDAATRVEAAMREVRGIVDVGVLRQLGQPELEIAPDRERCARDGVNPGDLADTVEAAIGGKQAGELFEGERRFPVMVRLDRRARGDLQAIAAIPVAAGGDDAPLLPLGELASIRMRSGAALVQRDGGERLVSVEFAVRGRDLAGAVTEARQRVASEVKLPAGYRIEWSGEFGELAEAKQRLAWIVPVSLVLIASLLYAALYSLGDCLKVVLAVPLAATGGAIALWITGTDFSVSAVVGFISLFGVATMAAMLLVARWRALLREGLPHPDALARAAHQRFRPVLMTCLSACIGLLPSALSLGMGSETQRPLARVIVGGMALGGPLILLTLPALIALFHGRGRPTLEEP